MKYEDFYLCELGDVLWHKGWDSCVIFVQMGKEDRLENILVSDAFGQFEYWVPPDLLEVYGYEGAGK